MTTERLSERISDEEYFATPGLSYSGMRDLAVSPLRYWYLHVNPERPKIEPTPEMQFGSALHCAVLEPDEFLNRYACELSPADYPGLLSTMDDLRQWLRERGVTPKGTRKADAIAQVQAVDSGVPILDVIERRHAIEHQGKVMLKLEGWRRVYRAAESLRDEPKIQAILRDGEPERAFFRTDQDTGVRLKGKMDWTSPGLTLDFKTFSQKRGRSIDKTVADAIYYEGYYRQAVMYGILRGWPDWDGDYVLAFVESEEPHETRIRSLHAKCGGNATLYWTRALIEIRQMCRTYKECMDHFGIERPWRYAQSVDPLADEEMPGLNY